ncbi:type IV pilin protein [bacterium BD-1]|uniref:type IV pilin protein n=1 Tax=Arenimonas sp. TaxID=1872635 RepID=UPI001E49B3E2|nr:type IV pilin protein [Ottowia caeni]
MTLHQNKERGFTLIELMIAVAIVAVLAGIAYPSYVNYVTNTRRAAAAACLTEMSQFMERYYTTNMDYEDASIPERDCEANLADFYTIGLSGEPTKSAYTLTAVPKGAQLSRDTKCGTLGLDQTGDRTETGTAEDASECW